MGIVIIVCVVVLIPLALLFIYKVFSSNKSNNSDTNGARDASESQYQQNGSGSALRRLHAAEFLAEVNKHDSLKNEFLATWDKYVTAVNTANTLINKIQNFGKDLLSQVGIQGQTPDKIPLVEGKIKELEKMKISIPAEKERTVNQLRIGASFIQDEQAPVYQNQYIPELQKATASINQAIPKLEADYKELDETLNQAAEDTADTAYTR